MNEETPRYSWVRVEHRGVTWHLVPEANAAHPLGYAIAIVLQQHDGKRRVWRGNLFYAGRTWWAQSGSTLRTRRLVEDWLHRKCWEWDGQITNSAYEKETA